MHLSVVVSQNLNELPIWYGLKLIDSMHQWCLARYSLGRQL